MAKKLLEDVINQLGNLPNDENQGFAELTPEEAEELSGGLDSVTNNGCPVYNTGCPRPPEAA